jgi:hypothetical protein
MQTASGYLILSPENKQFHRGITPAQALIMRKLHYSNSQGNPLEGLVIDGEATEPDGNGGQRPRSNGEEVARLKRFYTGIVNGERAFESVFGKGTMVRLPETFDDVREELGDVFVEARPQPHQLLDAEAHAWTPQLQAELTDLETTHKRNKEQNERLAELREYKENATNLRR